MNPGTKIIHYRGGLVSFSLPSHWREEYDPEGGGLFYEDKPDSGTLRLNVISAESKNGRSSEEGLEHSFPAGSYEMLPCGARLRRRKVPTEEQGMALVLYRWEIGVAVPPVRLRIVCFTHTVLVAQEAGPAAQGEIALIDEAVRHAEFSREPGA